MFDINIPAGVQVDTRTEYARLHDAITKAGSLARELVREFTVTDRESGTVAHVATYVEGRYFHPNERVTNPRFLVPNIDQWVLAYDRKRIEAAVYRHVSEKGRWLVRDGRTGGLIEVPTTRAACILTREMRQGLLIEA